MASKLRIQTYQILRNDDEVCIPSLSGILLAVLILPLYFTELVATAHQYKEGIFISGNNLGFSTLPSSLNKNHLELLSQKNQIDLWVDENLIKVMKNFIVKMIAAGFASIVKSGFH